MQYWRIKRWKCIFCRALDENTTVKSVTFDLRLTHAPHRPNTAAYRPLCGSTRTTRLTSHLPVVLISSYKRINTQTGERKDQTLSCCTDAMLCHLCVIARALLISYWWVSINGWSQFHSPGDAATSAQHSRESPNNAQLPITDWETARLSTLVGLIDRPLYLNPSSAYTARSS